MLRSFPSLALLLTTVLLSGCHTGSDEKEPSPWSRTFGADGQVIPFLAVDPSGAVAMAGSFTNDIDLGKGTLQGTAFDQDLFVGMFGSDGKPRWSGASGSPGDQLATSVAFDPDGDIVMVGAFSNQVDFGGHELTALQQDAFLVRLDRAGKTTLVKHWSGDDGGPSGAGTIFPRAMAATSDGITFAGTFTGSVGFGGPPLNSATDNETSFVARVDHEGQHVFSVAFGGQLNEVDALAVDDGGDIYVAGANAGSVEIGKGSLPATDGQNHEFVARLGADGTPRWTFQVNQPNPAEQGSSAGGPIALDPSGALYVAGLYNGAVEIAQQQLSTFTPSSYVMKLSGDGEPLWVHDFPKATITGLGVDDEGRVIVGGGYSGASDFGGGMLPDLYTQGAFITTLEPAQGEHKGTLILGVPDLQSGISNLVVTGKDVIVAGNFVGGIALPGKTLMQTVDNGFGIDFLARINL